MTAINPPERWNPPAPFSTDPRFLLVYYRNSTVLFFAACLILLTLRWLQIFTADEFLNPHSIPLGVGIAILAVYVGMQSGVLIHHASHWLFRPRLLNLIIGELAGLHQLYGFPAVRIVHQIHHRYPDDPRLDPHFPGSSNYWSFVLKVNLLAFKSLSYFYFRIWGIAKPALALWRRTSYFSLSSIIFRLLFIYLLLGYNLFILFYLPSYLAMALFAGFVNFYAHQPDEKQEFRVRNLTGPLFDLINKLFLGILMHKNHHQNPTLFNPAQPAKSPPTAKPSGFLWPYLFSIVGLLLVCLMLLYFRQYGLYSLDRNAALESMPVQVSLTVLGAYIGGISGVLIHNASHMQFRPRFLNGVLGELAGFQMLLGFRSWAFAHSIHHRYPDDPKLDPHYPGHWRFIPYTLNTFKMQYQKLRAAYFHIWGDSKNSHNSWTWLTWYWALGIPLRALIIYLALGRQLFCLVFIPSYLSIWIVFSLLNFYTHRPGSNGKFEIVNLNTGIYSVLNWLFFGLFFHKNHHLNPSLFNPKKMKNTEPIRSL
jgi:fatty acid desaturase